MAEVGINARDFREFYRAMHGINRRLDRELRDVVKRSAKIVESRARELSDSEKINATIHAGTLGGLAYVAIGNHEVPEAALREVGNLRDRRAMVRSSETGRFRHPVYAGPNESRQDWAWVEQDMHPVVGPAAREKQQAMLDELSDGMADLFATEGLRLE